MEALAGLGAAFEFTVVLHVQGKTFKLNLNKIFFVFLSFRPFYLPTLVASKTSDRASSCHPSPDHSFTGQLCKN